MIYVPQASLILLFVFKKSSDTKDWDYEKKNWTRVMHRPYFKSAYSKGHRSFTPAYWYRSLSKQIFAVTQTFVPIPQAERDVYGRNNACELYFSATFQVKKLWGMRSTKQTMTEWDQCDRRRRNVWCQPWQNAIRQADDDRMRSVR
jgi:hypothetical protein